MVGPINTVGPAGFSGQTEARKTQSPQEGSSFGAVLQQQLERSQTRQVAFSKHALSRAEERGIEVTPTLLERLGVPPDQKLSEMSKGTRTKLSIVTALSHGSRLLVLDEPTSGLDPVVRDDILDLLWDFVQDEQNAVLISSHITSDLEKVADYIVFLNQGRVVFEKPKDELRYRWGMLRCGAERFRTLDPADLVAWRQQDYEYEALVYDREAAHKKYPDALIDPATIDEIMLMHIRGEKP